LLKNVQIYDKEAKNLKIKTPNLGNLKRLLAFISTAGKGKGIPVQAWRVPEDFRRLRLPDFKTIGT
jgi:hypothetical protein